MLNVTRSPSALEARAIASASSTIERAAAVIEEPLPATEEARHRRIRCRLVRALLDDPILCFSDLDGGERAYLQSQRRYLLPQIHEATGLVPEIRWEGIAMVDDAAELTDLKLPKEGTDGHLTLLLAEWLATQARDCPGVSVPFSAVEQHIANLIRVYCSRWRKDVRELGAEDRLAEETLQRLDGLRLIRTTPDGVVPLAAIGRYALGQVSVTSNE